MIAQANPWGPVIFATLLPISLGIVAYLIRLAGLLGQIRQELHDHGRRLDVIETAAVAGPVAGRQRKREIEDE